MMFLQANTSKITIDTEKEGRLSFIVHNRIMRKLTGKLSGSVYEHEMKLKLN